MAPTPAANGLYSPGVGELLLIRHGQASYGEADYDRLSPRGVEQAHALGAYLAAARIDTLYAGPLRRQQQTAQHATEAAATASVRLPEVVTLAGLAEYPAFEMLKHLVPRLVAIDPRFADLERAPTPRLLDDAFHAVLTRWASDEWAVEGLERAGAFAARVRDALDGVIRAARSGARVACITSAGPIGVAVALVFGLDPARAIRTSIVIRNASITELRFRSRGFEWDPDHLSLVTFNTTGHLPAALHTER